MSASNSTIYQSSNSSSSTLRPRNTRLISFIDDGVDSNGPATTTTLSDPPNSTSLFPAPGITSTQSLGRRRSLNKGLQKSTGKDHVRKTSVGGQPGPSTDLWSSWSSYASSFLGGESSVTKGQTGQRQPKWMKQDKTYAPATTVSSWGPDAKDKSTTTLVNPLEDRQALLQAKRREALLIVDSVAGRDTSGKYKRRDSNAYSRDEDAEGEALVYIHKILLQDTLAGVMLRYGCQPDVFRKVNRFWPNDNVQTRKHVFLPVEACSVRGRKVEEPDLLGSLLAEVDLDRGPLTSAKSFPASYDGIATRSPTHTDVFRSLSNAEEHELKHESWVVIDNPNFPNPVEILRMPRSALGYFPRARRKSNTSPANDSVTSTPRTSFDMLRHPPTHAAQVSHSVNASPVRRPHMRPGSSRQRSSSTTATQNSFVEALRGPGGVGDLRGLRTNPSRPGPAEDSLNKKFAQYLPEFTLAPPQEMPRPFLSPGRVTPRASIDSVRSHRSNSSGLGDVPGAIEGFVRKMAGVKGLKGPGISKMGDLIELETNTDLGEPLSDNEDAQATPTGLKTTLDLGDPSNAELLDERFPVRGRVMNAYGKDDGKPKGGI